MSSTRLAEYEIDFCQIGVAVRFLDEAGMIAFEQAGVYFLGGVAAHENDLELRLAGD